ncbi:MAG: M15 family metallopeptidase [Erysipelotrichaceae bacterium]|nr:M15 family metallopeptidase [Erysipelotrichaceae bacterium]
MKRVLILLLLLGLCACKKETVEDKLRILGYTEEAIRVICSLPETQQKQFIETYDEHYSELLVSPYFEVDHLEEYLRYYGTLSNDKMMEMVNQGLLDENTIFRMKEIYESDYYIPAYEELYLQYLDQYPSVRQMMEVVNTGTYKPFFTEIKETDMSKGYLILVNKYYTLAADYEPEDLVGVESEYGKGYLREEAYAAFKLLHDDAYKLGYNIRVVSPYRSYDYQVAVYDKYLQRDPQEVVDSYSARPGLSEHQTGLCADVCIPGIYIDDFGQYPASDWLAENAHKYGFIIRFPQNKEEITGYIWEAWHIRYVGVEVATDIYERGITFDEYYACFIEDHE